MFSPGSSVGVRLARLLCGVYDVLQFMLWCRSLDTFVIDVPTEFAERCTLVDLLCDKTMGKRIPVVIVWEFKSFAALFVLVFKGGLHINYFIAAASGDFDKVIAHDVEVATFSF